MTIMHEIHMISNHLHIDTTHDRIPTHSQRVLMIAQKRMVRVTLDIMCYDDLELEDMDWKDILDLEGDEEVYATIKDYSNLF